MEVEKTLKRAEVFLGLDDNDLNKIASLNSCREKSYQPGELIFQAGDEAKYLYILKEGQVHLLMDILTTSKKEKVLVDRITTGAFFGWTALVRPHFYVMSAICEKPSTVVLIGGTELIALFDKDNYIGYKVFQSLSHVIGTRLRDIEQLLVKGQRWPFLDR